MVLPDNMTINNQLINKKSQSHLKAVLQKQLNTLELSSKHL